MPKTKSLKASDDHVRALQEESKARARYAYANYSKFRVGAILTTKEGGKFSGVNVENASYGLSMCAERSALFQAIAEGAKDFNEVAVYSSGSKLTPPCGACLQVLNEFLSSTVQIYIFNDHDEYWCEPLQHFLPHGFDNSYLKS